MIVYRLAKENYKYDLSGNGAKMYGSRWNSPGKQMLYTAPQISLAIMETLVHLDKVEIPENFWLIHIEIPESFSITEISIDRLKTNWQNDHSYTAFIGSEFLTLNKSGILKVPSAFVDSEYDFLFNPLHKEFGKIKITRSAIFKFDNRLLIR
jgi:RES domain-containing protein